MPRQADARQQRRRDYGNQACHQWHTKAAIHFSTKRNDDCRREEATDGAGRANSDARRRQAQTQQHARDARRDPADDEYRDEDPASKAAFDDTAKPEETGRVEGQVQHVQVKK